jgi:hypothetical protein
LVIFIPPEVEPRVCCQGKSTGKKGGGYNVLDEITHNLAGIPNHINAYMDCGDGGYALFGANTSAQGNTLPGSGSP